MCSAAVTGRGAAWMAAVWPAVYFFDQNCGVHEPMAARSLTALLEKLERQRYRFGAGEAERTVRLITELGRRRFTDVDLLIRFHEVLLFVRAFAHSAAVARASERLLRSFERRVEE